MPLNPTVNLFLYLQLQMPNICQIKKKEKKTRKWTPEGLGTGHTGGGNKQAHCMAGSQAVWGPEVQPR